MKKVTLSGAIFLLSLSLIFFLFEFSFLAYFDNVFAVGAPQIQNANTKVTSTKDMLYDKPWSNLMVNYQKIIKYPERVEPSAVLTFTYSFGNDGTTPIENATIMCFPPNMSLPQFLGPKPFTWWRGEVAKGTIPISDPKIEPLPAAAGQALVDTIFWSVKTIPQKGAGADSNYITFQLEIDISQVDITQDLQCWVGLFYGAEAHVPKTFGVVKITVEVKPRLEVFKSVLHHSVLPGESNTITITYYNHSTFRADSVTIYDYFYSMLGMTSGDAKKWITIEEIIPPPTIDEFPKLTWKNIVIDEDSSSQITLRVRVKPYQEIKSLFNGAEVQIIDTASVNLPDYWFNRDTCSFYITARDLEPSLEPKLFGNYASPGFPLLLHGRIKNIGSTPVYESFRVKIWLNDQRNTPFCDTLITKRIEAGDGLYIPAEAPPLPEGEGDYIYYIETDYLNNVSEVDETNNIDSIIVRAKLETLKTTVNNSTRTDQVTIFGKQPSFPDPIFSYVMITDQNYHYIKGLADPTQWLTLQDLTPLGVTVQQVWSPALEYHEEDPNLPAPAEQDVYLKPPGPSVTRIDEANPNGFSVAVIIDGNMNKTDSTVAAAAARVLIQQMRAQDQMAVVKFSDRDLLIKNFTNNQPELNVDITTKFSSSSAHRLYDALYNGITATAQQQGRKAVFVYTSAKNNGSSRGLSDVVNHADSSGVPVFVFGFGNADQASLQQLADRTGGLFIYEQETRDMWYIFKLFAEMFKNHYVLAHTTTDATLDGTWRLVDVTANYPTSGFTDADIGKYKAPNIGVDLFIKKEAETVLFSSGGIDTIRYANADEIFTYIISFGNQGSIPGLQVQIRDVLPDSVDIVAGSFSRQPDNTADNQHQLFWQYEAINPGDNGLISFKVRVKKRMPPWQIALIDSAFIIYEQDQKPNNNLSVNIVYANPLTPPPPNLRATPEKIRPRDPINVDFQCFEELRDWDIKIYFEDGSVIEDFADDYIAAHPILLPTEALDIWLRIISDFLQTWKRTDKSQEKITFKFTARNVYGQHFEIEVSVIVEASFECLIHPIIIKPGVPGGADRVYLDLTLTKDHTVGTSIYNVAGELVRKLEDIRLSGGDKHINALSWDGRDDSGNLVASDVYVIIVKAGTNEATKKVVVIR